jgi:multimeric flavodoxin WrbA
MSWKTEPIKILGVSGSPRDSATLYCLKRALKVARSQKNVSTHLVDMSSLNIKPCLHCDKCYQPDYYKKTGHRCVQEDDMEKVFPHILDMDGLLVASPCYAGSISAQTKLFFDRTRPVARIYSQKLIAAQAIAVGGALHGGQSKTISDLHYIMNWYGMIVIPFRTWFSPHGAKVWSDHPSDDKSEEGMGAGLAGVKADKHGMDAIDEMGKKMVWGTRLIKHLNKVKDKP